MKALYFDKNVTITKNTIVKPIWILTVEYCIISQYFYGIAIQMLQMEYIHFFFQILNEIQNRNDKFHTMSCFCQLLYRRVRPHTINAPPVTGGRVYKELRLILAVINLINC